MNKSNSLWARIKRVFRSKAHRALDQIETTPDLLDDSIREYENNLAVARAQVAEVTGSIRYQEAQREKSLAAATEWGAKAAMAEKRAESFRARGLAPEAEQAQALALKAFEEQIRSEQSAAALVDLIESGNEQIAGLNQGLQASEQALVQARRERDELVSRDRIASAKIGMQTSMDAIDSSGVLSEGARIRERVELKEARAQGLVETSSARLSTAFDTLERSSVSMEAEERLEALRAGKALGAGDERKQVAR